MLAVFGDATRRAPKKLVAPRCPVAADNIDLRSWTSHHRGKITKQVEKLGIQGNYIAGSVISQKMIQLVYGVRKIGITNSVNDIYPLVSVQMEKRESVLLCGEISSRHMER